MMGRRVKKIIVTGAGSAQSNGVINSLLMASEGEEIIGVGCDPADLMMSKAHRRYLIPHSSALDYKAELLKVISEEQPDMIHFQHDVELSIAMRFRDEIEQAGVKMLIPDYETIDTCVHKDKSWAKFKAAGIKVPENLIINEPDDLKRAFAELANSEGKIWLRSMSVGGGGKGALPTSDFEEASMWIEKDCGWGLYLAAELLATETVTWLSIWRNGELIVAQTRRRKGWAHGALSRSGVTGITRIGETYSNSCVDEVAARAVKAVSAVPHGIYGVDMAYDQCGVPNPTEINISRFFTTIQFFSEAGLNMPKILKDLVLYDRSPALSRRINPLPDGLLWLRAMDCTPVLTTQEEIERSLIVL
jgi:hypothetical protein